MMKRKRFYKGIAASLALCMLIPSLAYAAAGEETETAAGGSAVQIQTDTKTADVPEMNVQEQTDQPEISEQEVADAVLPEKPEQEPADTDVSEKSEQEPADAVLSEMKMEKMPSEEIAEFAEAYSERQKEKADANKISMNKAITDKAAMNKAAAQKSSEPDNDGSVIPENQWLQTASTRVWYFGDGLFYSLKDNQMDVLGFWIVGATAVQNGDIWTVEGGTEYEYEEYKNTFGKEPPLPEELENLRPEDPNPNPNPGDGDDDKDDPDNPGTGEPDPDDPDNPGTGDPDPDDPGTDDPDPDDPDNPGIDDSDPDDPDNPGTDDPDPDDPDNPGTDDTDPDDPDSDNDAPDPVVPEEIHIGYIPRDEWVQIGSTYYYWIWGSLSVCSLPDGGQKEELRWHLITEGIYESQDGDLWITGRGYTYEEFSSTIDRAEYPSYLPDFSEPDDNSQDTGDGDSSANDSTDLNNKDIVDNTNTEKTDDAQDRQSERDKTIEETAETLADILKRAGVQIAKDKLEEWVDEMFEKYPALDKGRKTLNRINAAYDLYKSGKELSEDWARVQEAQAKANEAGVRNEEIAPFAKKWTSKVTENAYDLIPPEVTDVTDFFGITNDQTGEILGEKAGNWAAGFVNYVQKPAYQQRDILREFGNENPEMSYN